MRFNLTIILIIIITHTLVSSEEYIVKNRLLKIKRGKLMSKFLIAINSADDLFLNEWRKNGLNTAVIFKPCKKVMRVIRKIWIMCGLPFQEIWYGEIKEKVCEADTIIVHMSSLTISVCKYINKRNPSARVIAWWWNKIDNRTKPSLQKGKYEAWSFDLNDCKKYNLRFNHQYYFKSLIIPPQKNKYDIYFCGIDAGRGEEITRLYYEFIEMNLNVSFQVVYPQNKLIPPDIISDYVNYDEIRQSISQSCSILEVMKDGQAGPTLRMMESIYFQKKLITNNAAVKDEDFYNENRIFLYTERPLSELKSFLSSDFVPYEDKLIDKFDVSQWAKNFIKDE